MYTVSTSTSLLSTNWVDHEGLTLEQAKKEIEKAKKKGLVYLLFDEDEEG